MSKFLSYDGLLMQFMMCVSDYVILNFLFIIGCIPIITIGASIKALYSVSIRRVKKEEPAVFKEFISAYKENIGTSIVCFLASISAFGVFILYFRIIRTMPDIIKPIFYVIFGSLFIIVLAAYIFLFPNMAVNKVPGIKIAVKEALILGISRLPYTLLLIAIYILIGFAVLTIPYAPGVIIMSCLIFGFSFFANIRSRIFAKVL